jgi:HD-GYP domain-containing protein (c-di-GMP phosphodiesterase class II)
MDTVQLSDLVLQHAAWLAPHGERAARFATSLGQCLGMDSSQLDRLAAAATLHDVGKIQVRADIVNKPGPLDHAEWQEMRRHPVHGYWLLYRIVDHEIAEAVLCHHEHYDGAGYPFGLSGTAIPLLSRVLSVADAYDAMTNDRPYRRGVDAMAARLVLEANAGTQFDPDIVTAMLGLLGERRLVAVA